MKTIELKDLDRTNTLYHFTNKNNIEKIEKLGLIPMIGNNSKGIEKTKKVFFSKGNIGFLRICDVWINWIIYSASMKNYINKRINEENNYRKLLDEYKELFKTGIFYTKENINSSFEQMSEFMSQNIVLSLDLEENKHYKKDDLDEAKERANDQEFITKMYCGYVSSNRNVEEFNMHTISDINIPKEQISLVIENDNISALNILKSIYELEKEKDKNLKFKFLDDFMKYLEILESINLKRR